MAINAGGDGTFRVMDHCPKSTAPPALRFKKKYICNYRQKWYDLVSSY